MVAGETYNFNKSNADDVFSNHSLGHCGPTALRFARSSWLQPVFTLDDGGDVGSFQYGYD
jgi:hypothetical protein